MKPLYTKIDLSEHKTPESFNSYLKQMINVYVSINDDQKDHQDNQKELLLVFDSFSQTDIIYIVYPYSPELNFREDTYEKFINEGEKYVHLYIFDTNICVCIENLITKITFKY